MTRFLNSLLRRRGALVLPVYLLAGFGLAVIALGALSADRGYTPPAGLANRVEPDSPGEAAAFRVLSQQDENGQIPPNALLQAEAHVDLMQASRQVSAPNYLGTFTWNSIGPGNVGGRVRSILIHPTDANVMWTGSVAGGVFKTTDGGASWQPTGFMGNLAVTSLIMNPFDANVIWASTGEGFAAFNDHLLRGAGIFKSVDGGSTWTQLASTANASFYWTNRLAISPDGATLLAATRTGLWRSTNSGATWTLALSGDLLDVKFHPTQSLNAVAGSGATAYYSINNGQSWAQSPGLPAGRVELAYAASAANTVYASVDINSGEIWKSTNGGQSYTKKTPNANDKYLSSQGSYANTIWVDPTNENTLVVGGLDLWRSTDGGATLTQISTWWLEPKSAHADHQTIVASPGFNGTTNKTVFFGNDGGVYKTDDVYTVTKGDPPNGWINLNNRLRITQFFSAAGNTTSGTIVGGTQDNGTKRFTGGAESWTNMFGGDGGWSAADPTDPNYFYGEYIYLTIHRSTDGGLTSSYIHSGLTDAVAGCALFIAPFILDPNNPNTMLAGACRLWRSTNVKSAIPTWQVISDYIDGKISAIAVHPWSSSEIWIGTTTGAVYRTYNGTAASPTWERVDDSFGLPNRYVTRITLGWIGDASSRVLVPYITFGGYNADNVWSCGIGCQPISGSGLTALPAVPVRSLVVHPDPENWNLLFAGTEVGVFLSEDYGASWNPFRAINPAEPGSTTLNVSVDELFWLNHVLVAATHGRGLYRTDMGIHLSDVWTLDGSGNFKSTFAPGEPIRYAINVNPLISQRPITLTFEAYTPDGQQEYSWQEQQTSPVSASFFTHDTTVPNNVGGTHTFTGSVTYEGHTQSLAVTYTVTGSSAPFHDNFAAAVFTSGSGTFSGNSSGATLESSETAPCASIGGTVWYQVVPDQSGLWTASTAGSGFDTVLALYTGSSIPTLTNLACNDDIPGSVTSEISATVTAGQTYYLQLGGFSGATGAFQLQMAYAPPAGPANDNFAAATPLGGGPNTASGSTEGATVEAGEPSPCGLIGTTVWYQVVPNQSGTLTASTAGSGFDTVLALYSGSDLAGLANLTCNDDDPSIGPASQFSAEVTAGQTYYLQLGGYSGAAGAFQLEVSYPAPPGGPANDSFAAVESLGVPGTASGSTVGATDESGEPSPCGGIGNAVWYQVTPDQPGTLTASSAGSNFDTVLALYTGSDLASLANLACNDDGPNNIWGDFSSEFSAEVVAGQTYYLQLGGYGGATGDYQLHVSLAAPTSTNSLFYLPVVIR